MVAGTGDGRDDGGSNDPAPTWTVAYRSPQSQELHIHSPSRAVLIKFYEGANNHRIETLARPTLEVTVFDFANGEVGRQEIFVREYYSQGTGYASSTAANCVAYADLSEPEQLEYRQAASAVEKEVRKKHPAFSIRIPEAKP